MARPTIVCPMSAKTAPHPKSDENQSYYSLVLKAFPLARLRVTNVIKLKS